MGSTNLQGIFLLLLTPHQGTSSDVVHQLSSFKSTSRFAWIGFDNSGKTGSAAPKLSRREIYDSFIAKLRWLVACKIEQDV